MKPPPLTAAIAAAIRDTWPKHMRKTYADIPGYFTHCACQHGTTPPCQKGRHDLCGRATPLRRPEAAICDPRGMVTTFPQTYQHPSDVNAVGPGYTSAAQVWLADRVCRWQCPCTCHTSQPTPTPAKAIPLPLTPAAPTPKPRAAAASTQLDLLDLIGADR